MTNPGTVIVSIHMERIGELSWLVYMNDVPYWMFSVTDEDIERYA